MTKNNTGFLALLIFHETISKNPKKYFRVISFVIYTIIDHYVCIYYLACQLKKLGGISVNSKYLGGYFNIILGIGITYLLINLL